MDALHFYATQSRMTDPGRYAGLFEDLPDSIEQLCAVVQGLCIHFGEGDLYGIQIPADRMAEINIRPVEQMLARILELDPRPLSEARPPENRLIGYCRTPAVLLCAMARHKGIPIRHRAGFATYFVGTGIDAPGSHELVEYWDIDNNFWRLADPSLDRPMIQKNDIRFDILDVPRDQFLTGGRAWQACRSGQMSGDHFGIDQFRGLWFVRNNMLQDWAALNKIELLNWDNWGLMLRDMDDYSAVEWDMLDDVAKLIEASNSHFAQMRDLYNAESLLQVPKQVRSFGPAGPASEEIFG